MTDQLRSNERSRATKSMKFSCVIFLFLLCTGRSYAGFKDALKSAAGGALSEVVTAVTNSTAEQATAGAAKINSTANAANGTLAELKDESSISKEDFMKANKFSEAEYLQWLGEVTKQLTKTKGNGAKWSPVSGIPVEGLIIDKLRVKLPADEAGKVFCVVENSGILLAQECAYILSGNVCIKFNYTTLAAGKCDERGDVMRNPEAGRVIHVIEGICFSATGKMTGIASERRKESEKAKEGQSKQAEKERLEKFRSGLVAYAPSSIQWGDSPEVLNKICDIFVSDSYYDSSIDQGYAKFFDSDKRHVYLSIYPGVGVYSICVGFPSGSVTPEQLIEKYTKEFGSPAIEEKRGFKQILDEVIYRWDAKTHTVEIRLPGFGTPSRLEVKLTRLELLKAVDALKQKKKDDSTEKQKAETQKTLNF